MNKWLIVLSSVASNSTSSSGESTTNKIYPLYTAIFWYIFFLIVIALFVIYLIMTSSNHKRFDNLIVQLGREINRYSNLCDQKKTNDEKNIFKYKKRLSSTIMLLNKFDVLFIEYQEKTRLNEFDRLMKMKDDIVGKIKKYENTPINEQNEYLNSIYHDLVEFKGQIELVRMLIKK